MNLRKPRLMCLLGEPGTGKGTLAGYLQLTEGYYRISTGDIVREQAKKETKTGKFIKELLDDGKFIPDRIVCQAVSEYLQYARTVWADYSGVVFDGFPRSCMQAAFITDWAEKNGDFVDFRGMFWLTNVTKSQIFDRLAHRFVCEKCGTSYSDIKTGLDTYIYKDSEQVAAGKKCGMPWCDGKLVRRADDTPELIEKRIVSTDIELFAICDWCMKNGILKTLDASKPAFDLYVEVLNYLR